MLDGKARLLRSSPVFPGPHLPPPRPLHASNPCNQHLPPPPPSPPPPPPPCSPIVTMSLNFAPSPPSAQRRIAVGWRRGRAPLPPPPPPPPPSQGGRRRRAGRAAGGGGRHQDRRRGGGGSRAPGGPRQGGRVGGAGRRHVGEGKEEDAVGALRGLQSGVGVWCYTRFTQGYKSDGDGRRLSRSRRTCRV